MEMTHEEERNEPGRPEVVMCPSIESEAAGLLCGEDGGRLDLGGVTIALSSLALCCDAPLNGARGGLDVTAARILVIDEPIVKRGSRESRVTVGGVAKKHESGTST